MKHLLYISFFFFLSFAGANQESTTLIEEEALNLDLDLAVSVSDNKTITEISSSIVNSETWLKSNVLSLYPSTKITTIVVFPSSSLEQQNLVLVLSSLKNLHHSLIRWGLENEIKVSLGLSSYQSLTKLETFKPVLIFLESINSTFTINQPLNHLDLLGNFGSFRFNKVNFLNPKPEQEQATTTTTRRRTNSRRNLRSFVDVSRKITIHFPTLPSPTNPNPPIGFSDPTTNPNSPISQPTNPNSPISQPRNPNSPISHPPINPNPPISQPTNPNPPISQPRNPNSPISQPRNPNSPISQPPVNPNPPISQPRNPNPQIPQPPTNPKSPISQTTNPTSPTSSPQGLYLPPQCLPSPPPSPSPAKKKDVEGLWCVAKPTVAAETLQQALDFACGQGGADCDEIRSPHGICFYPNTVMAHASYALNSYWQKTKRNGGTCSFGGTAMLITTDPSYQHCRFIMS